MHVCCFVCSVHKHKKRQLCQNPQNDEPLESARKTAAEHLKAADVSAVAPEGRGRRVIALITTVAYYSNVTAFFKRHGKHLVGRRRATGSCTLISDEAEYTW